MSILLIRVPYSRCLYIIELHVSSCLKTTYIVTFGRIQLRVREVLINASLSPSQTLLAKLAQRFYQQLHYFALVVCKFSSFMSPAVHLFSLGSLTMADRSVHHMKAIQGSGVVYNNYYTVCTKQTQDFTTTDNATSCIF